MSKAVIRRIEQLPLTVGTDSEIRRHRANAIRIRTLDYLEITCPVYLRGGELHMIDSRDRRRARLELLLELVDVFGITLERIQGYQSVFFLLQGLAVAATIRFRPVTWLFWPALAATWIFNLLASISYVVPFYSRGLPSWLEGWQLLPAS